MQTDIFLKVISTSDDGGTITACYPQDTIEEAHELFETVKKRCKEINRKFLENGFEAREEKDYFEISDRFTEYWFCVKVVEQPRLIPELIVEELEADGFFD
jgi:hypothetical protein